MLFPHNGVAGVVSSFFTAFLCIFGFSFFYLRRYRDPYDTERSPFITSVLGLAIVLVTSALLPVDIFLISFMKTPEGQFKPWAQDLDFREHVEDVMLYCYYAAYALVFFCLFILIPFIYFFYEAKDDDGYDNDGRICSALKFTLIFVFVAVVLLLLGAFVPLKPPPPTNSTEWERIKEIFENLGTNKGEDAISMVLSILCAMGMLNLIFYTGFGVSSWPIGLIRGTSSARKQFEEIQNRNVVIQTRLNALRDKQRITNRLNAREKRLLAKLEEEERNMKREEEIVDRHVNSWWYKLRTVIRPFEIGLGTVTAILAFVLWVSLLLTNIDRDLHSMGMKMGYALQNFTLPNPIDMLLIESQKVFPLDYVIILGITWLLVMCTLSGIRNLGVRLFLVKMYKLRRQKTPPQGLLLTCATLMLTVLAINVFLYSVSPQYMTYGNQHYMESTFNGTDSDLHVTKPCPDSNFPRNCTMTRNSALLLRFFYKAWYFGAFYHWATWGYIIISALALMYALIRKSRSITEGMFDSEDFEESDERPMIR